MNDLFSNCFDEAAIKTRFLELCKRYHPDLGGSHEAMIALMAAYEERLRGEFRKSMSDDDASDAVAMEREVADKVAEVIGLEGLIVELVGRWIWATGDTWTHRARLKASAFYWAAKKKAWYWHKPEDSVARGGKKSLEEIRSKYGSKILRAGAGRACLQ